MASYLEKLGGVLGFNKGKGNSKERTRIQEIESLKEELVKAGYQYSEAEYFIKNAVGTVDITKMDNGQLDVIIKKVKAQLIIAKKCKESIK